MTRGAALAASLWLAALGCAGASLDASALPDAPIAFVYRSVEETQRMLEDAQAKQDAADTDDKFDVKLEGLERWAGRRTSEDVARDQGGRIGLYVASERRLDLPDALPRGARPIAWSPDHARLMFGSAQRGSTHLFEWIRATGEVRQLTAGGDTEIDGCYGADGAIAWVQLEGSGEDLSTRIWLRRPGEPPTPVTPGPSDVQPTCSPDGTRIVYSALDPRAGQTLRWVEPASGASGSLGPGRSPAYSPDGEWIVYSARTTAGWRLRRMHADGSGKRSLGASGFEEGDPSVSPDGRYVVFSGTKEGKAPVTRLFVRTMDGATDRQLEFGGSGLLPVW